MLPVPPVFAKVPLLSKVPPPLAMVIVVSASDCHSDWLATSAPPPRKIVPSAQETVPDWLVKVPPEKDLLAPVVIDSTSGAASGLGEVVPDT